MMEHSTAAPWRALTRIRRRETLSRVLPLLMFIGAISVTMLGLSSLTAVGEELTGPIAMATAGLAIAVIVFEIWRHGDIQRIARRMDYRLRSAELLSTALGARPEMDASPVGRSLLRRAEGYANALDIDRAAPILSRATVLAAAALILATGGVWVGSILGSRPVSVAETAETPIVENRAPIGADDVEILARLLAEDAERHDSDYLEAVANSLEELAEAARRGMTQPDLQAELQTLIDHAQRGYEGRLPRWMADMPAGDAGALLQNARAFDEQRQAAALARQQAAENGDQPVAGGRSSDMYNLPEDRLTRSANAPSSASQGLQEGDMAARAGDPSSAGEAGEGFAARPMEEGALESAGAFPIGAAAQSGKGESNMAGGGSQPFGPDSQYLESMPDPSQTMTISATDTQQGNRIRLHVPTTAEQTDAGAAAIDPNGSWARQAAEAINRQAVGPEADAVVSRYFNRPIDEPGGVGQ